MEGGCIIMPDSGDWIYIDTNTGTTGNWSYSFSTSDPIQQMWEEHQKECDKQDRERAELAKDKQKYPLFFLKEGIV